MLFMDMKVQSVHAGWLCLLYLVTVADGLKCFGCFGESSPGLCNNIFTCGQNQVCYTEKTFTRTGGVVWNFGCRHPVQCTDRRGLTTNNPPSGNPGGEDSTCDSCCSWDYCNLEQCGYKIPMPTGPPRRCYDCTRTPHPTQCTTITDCPIDGVCMMREQYDVEHDSRYFVIGCEHKSVCQTITTSLDNCTYCCDRDMCNSDCNGGYLKQTIPPLTVPPTFGPRTDGLFCYVCDVNKNTSDLTACQIVRQCGENQACYIDEFYHSDGSFSYQLGCRDIHQCSGSTHIVGKRSQQLITCSECCYGDLCQKTLCGRSALKQRQDRGPVCFNCVTSQSNDTCEAVTECSSNEACYLSSSYSSSTYIHGCIRVEVCETADVTTAKCFKCCLGDLCNNSCQTS